MEDEENLDLLDLDDGSSDVLPDVAPLSAPRPKKPWLLMLVGVAVVALTTCVIVRSVGGNNSSSMEIDLDAPAVMVDGDVADIKPMPKHQESVPAPVAPVVPLPQPAAKPEPVAVQPEQTTGVPVRVIEDRKDVTFNPNKEVAPVKTVSKPVAQKVIKKPVVKANANTWYVQLGSYSSRALAESGERQLRAAHPALFAGQQTVILAAVLKNGTTTYRLRVAFKNQNEANGFCRNAKSDGLDCYVAK